jgi:hypothetical protein
MQEMKDPGLLPMIDTPNVDDEIHALCAALVASEGRLNP